MALAYAVTSTGLAEWIANLIPLALGLFVFWLYYNAHCFFDGADKQYCNNDDIHTNNLCCKH